MKKNPEEITLVAIGTSAGGVAVLHHILPAFTGKRLAVVVVIHLPPTGPNLIPSLYAEECGFRLKEAESGEPIVPGTIYIAPPDYHLSVEPQGTLSLSNEEEFNFSRPSIDILFDSVAFAYKSKAMGLLLTGANNDGAEGLKTIARLGGMTIVQDPSDAEYPTMPQSALELNTPDGILSVEEIKQLIRSLT